MRIDLSIIIVNYNGIRFLADCLNSIREHVSCPHEVIVVDNASTDRSGELLRKHFPHVHLIDSEKNLGFSGGNNLGANASNGDLLLLLNNDTRLISSLTPAIKEFDAHKQLGVLGCRMFYENGDFQPSVGFEHTPLRLGLSWTGIGGFSFAPRIFKRVDDEKGHYKVPHEAAWVSGAFLMTRKYIWDKLGGLDERYFMYMEDVDYCRRARIAGYKVAYTPIVEIIHYEGAGKAWIGEKALTDSMRSYIVYIGKFQSKYTVLLNRIALFAVMTARASAYGIASLVSRSQMYKEKRMGYFKAAKALLVKHID